ncbi:pyridoxamine 5'-phosphate oxidase [Deinococcus psychrotolerans]|uniref:Pyridoxine/pyridoxamine 5'-phosphate oxidase n=1 Tax=Deinococcus psychrotolerans TaxID=2489213 RepID=A0A3G8YF36_9DEIO|nr:pyridoxamine 5'-phosphate oxidase [Deinococcus psychrotolerans]AZI43585.1 pyridoxamine 5'-phosphate oxidase [Deinococcus psychrotolerans]
MSDSKPSSDLTQLRVSYTKGELRRADLAASPLEQFQVWFAEAQQSRVIEPYALSLATANPAGRPSVRTVLLRGAEERGLSFYTNYDSHKGHDLDENPQAELLFFWPDLERQVRVFGSVQRVSEEESATYFHKRPRESQLAAHASDPQSAPIANRDALEAKLSALEAQYPEGQTVPKPDFWGGYRLLPSEWEFWQGRANRMHDRFVYRRAGESWSVERLMP